SWPGAGAPRGAPVCPRPRNANRREHRQGQARRRRRRAGDAKRRGLTLTSTRRRSRREGYAIDINGRTARRDAAHLLVYSEGAADLATRPPSASSGLYATHWNCRRSGIFGSPDVPVGGAEAENASCGLVEALRHLVAIQVGAPDR